MRIEKEDIIKTIKEEWLNISETNSFKRHLANEYLKDTDCECQVYLNKEDILLYLFEYKQETLKSILTNCSKAYHSGDRFVMLEDNYLNMWSFESLNKEIDTDEIAEYIFDVLYNTIGYSKDYNSEFQESIKMINKYTMED